MERSVLPPLPGVDPATAPDPSDPSYPSWLESVVISPDGVDRSLVWEALHSSPEERLRCAQALADFVAATRDRNSLR